MLNAMKEIELPAVNVLEIILGTHMWSASPSVQAIKNVQATWPV